MTPTLETAVSPAPPRTARAAAPFRKHPRRARKAAAALLLGLLAGLALPAALDRRWVSPERKDFSALRARYTRDLGREAARLLPEASRAMGAVLDAVAAEWDRQDDRLPPLRDYRYLRGLLDDAGSALGYFEVNLAARRLGESSEAARRTDALEAGIAAARRSARGVSEIEVRRDLASAEIRAREARSYLGRMDFPNALRKAADGEERVASANRRTGEVRAHFTSEGNLAGWKRRIAAGIEASRGGRTALVVLKEKHRLDVYQDGRKLRSFPVELGSRPILPKLREGDRATPEGTYQVVEKLGKGRTVYTLALKLNYPNAEDRARFDDLRRRGIIPPKARIGGLIEIHGKGGRGFDWTLGCVALRDADMAWLFDRVPRGCPVIIVGSDGAAPDNPAPGRSAAKKGV